MTRSKCGCPTRSLCPGYGAKLTPEETSLIERRTEESKRRDGAVVSDDIIDYTETYHLTSIVRKNWDKFQPVFRDKKRTEAFFGIIEDVARAETPSMQFKRQVGTRGGRHQGDLVDVP